MSIKMTAAVLMAMVGGAAQAAPELVIGDDNGFADAQNRYVVEGTFMNDALGDAGAYLANPGVRSYSNTVASENLASGIDSLFANASIESAFSSTGFSFMTTTSGAVDTNENYNEDGVENFATARGRAGHNGSVTLTEDTMVRIRVDGSVTSSEPNTEWAHRVELSGGSLSPIVIGLEDNTTVASFDQTLSLSAGVYSWNLFNAFGTQSGFPGADGYSWDSTLNFSFEIVPAPGAAALFGLGGLAATRRRR